MLTALKKVEKGVELLFNICLFLLFGAIFVTVMIEVVTRFMPSVILPWTADVVRLNFMWVIALGAPLAIKYGEFARVDVLFAILPLRGRLILELFSTVVISIFCFIAGYTALPMIQVGQRMTSVALQIPMSYFFAAIPICFILAGISGVFRTIPQCKDVLNPQRVLDREKEAQEKLLKELKEIETVLQKDNAETGGDAL